MAERYKARVCLRSLAGVLSLNPTGGMDICVLCTVQLGQKEKPGKSGHRCKNKLQRENRIPPGTWMFVLCVVRKDKRQNAEQSRKRDKYWWSTEYKKAQKNSSVGMDVIFKVQVSKLNCINGSALVLTQIWRLYHKRKAASLLFSSIYQAIWRHITDNSNLHAIFL